MSSNKVEFKLGTTLPTSEDISGNSGHFFLDSMGRKLYVTPDGEDLIQIGSGKVIDSRLNNIILGDNDCHALTSNSIAEGMGSVAGVKGWQILKKPFKDSTGKYVIALKDVNPSITFTEYESDGKTPKDYTYSVYINGWFETLGKLTGISSDEYEGEGTLVYISDESASAWPPYALAASSFLYTPYEPLIGSQTKDAAQHAEGYYSYALTYAAHAEGCGTVAAGRYSHAEGNGTYAVYAAHAEGYGSKALGQRSHAEGSGATASGYYSHAEGQSSLASGMGSHSEGGYTLSGTIHPGGTASGSASHAEGEKTVASGLCAHAEGAPYDGILTTAEGDSSHAEGGGTRAKGNWSHAEGRRTIATGQVSHAEGDLSHAEGIGSHAEGYNSHALGAWSHTEGYETRALTQYAHAEGCNTEATGDNGAHAEGLTTTASGNAAHAEGKECVAGGIHSHAEGRNSQSTGQVSHAEGKECIAQGTCSHAQGESSKAYGFCSHAGGLGSTATGECSFAHGHVSHAKLKDSFALGFRVETSAERQTVVGAFNARTDGKFLVDIGTSDSALATGLRVDDYGNLFIKGGIYFECNNDCTVQGRSVADIYSRLDNIDNSGVGYAESSNVAGYAEHSNTASFADNATYANDLFYLTRDNSVDYVLKGRPHSYGENILAFFNNDGISPAGTIQVCHPGIYSDQGEYQGIDSSTIMGFYPLLLNHEGELMRNTDTPVATCDIYLTDSVFEQFGSGVAAYIPPPEAPEITIPFEGIYLSELLIGFQDKVANHNHSQYLTSSTAASTYATKEEVQSLIATYITSALTANYTVGG